jgi:peptidoglycan/xylan/chitin deacetylase (PgdA/CDA1 family)
VTSLKKKTAKWCVLISMIGGIVTSSSALASQSAIKKIQVPAPPREMEYATSRTAQMLKSADVNFPRFIVETPPAPAYEKTIYLTFDDGPHRVSNQILTLLDEYDAKATFFMLDGNMKEYPEAVKKMAQDGHSLGAHGVTHDKKRIYQSPSTVVAEMNQTLSTIKEITGIDSALIRTPYGSAPHMKEPYKKAVADKGYLMWDWNIDSKDWFYRDKRLISNTISQIENHTKKQEPIVILLHEREETLAQLPALLKYLKEKNYDFRPLNPDMVPIHLK